MYPTFCWSAVLRAMMDIVRDVTATLGEHLVAGRLYIAGFVPGATLYAIHINLTHNLLASIGQDVWPITLSAKPKRPILTV